MDTLVIDAGGMAIDCRSLLFHTFVHSNEASELLSKLESRHRILFEFRGDAVFVKGMHIGNVEAITKTLVKAWQRDDFLRALKISELTDASDCQLFFQLPPSDAALLQVNSRKLVRHPGLMNILTGQAGRVCLFLKGAPASEVFKFVLDSIKVAPYPGDVKLQHLFGDVEGPFILSIWVPDRRLRSVLLQIKFALEELQRMYSCFVDARFQHIVATGEVPVDISAKTLENVLNAKKALLELLDVELPGSSTVMLRRCGHPPSILTNSDIESGFTCENVLATVENVRLAFAVRCEEAPRLIGARGANRARIEGITRCSILLRTESKREGWFPVEIVGRTVESCENAKRHIENFLSEVPRALPSLTRVVSSPQKFFAGGVLLALPRTFRSSPSKPSPSKPHGERRKISLNHSPSMKWISSSNN